MTRLNELSDLGQAVWLDYIRRAFLTSGQLQEWVDRGLSGVTSNPSIFEKAIAGSADYDADLQPLVQVGRTAEEIYEALALEDIRLAADILRPVYDATNGLDGYVSLEVSPTLAHDTDGTVADARRLFAALGKPNVLIKVPATPEGIPAIEALIAEGININVTLIFSLAHYEAVADAYLSGLELLADSRGDLSKVASVASFFISRVDTAVDNALDELGEQELQGKIATANAKVAYARFQELFSGARWERLEALGARVQRPLWASTSTKNASYPDTLYVDGLIGPDTVNTVPPATLEAFLDHGTVASTLSVWADEARHQLARLTELHVDLDAITQRLQDDGVAAFAKSFEGLMASVEGKRAALKAGWRCLTAVLGTHQDAVDSALAAMESDRIIERIWAHDHTVWKSDPEEITNRLGWLHSPEWMSDNVARVNEFVDDVRADGFTHVLLLGMGGSSLAPEVFREAFGVAPGYLDLAVLDSTDPGAVLGHAGALDLGRTLFVVATKSGGTEETLSFFRYFYRRMIEMVGPASAGNHFVAITDPGSKLVTHAKEHGFRDVFLNDPNIGGRYSALSYFGLVPAALVGVDVRKLLDCAATMAANCDGCNCLLSGDNVGGQLGTVMGVLAEQGLDKLTLIASSAIASFGDWVEQLIAESTGKEGKGIVPVVGEPVGSPDVYGDDRLFVYVRLEGDDTHDEAVSAIQAAGHPVIQLVLRDRYDLGGQFYLWEMATAVAGHHLGINPFDQPNVEAAKVLARDMVATYQETKKLPKGDLSVPSAQALRSFIELADAGDYVALQAYVQPTVETDAALRELRTWLRCETGLATTVGYGPRYLHSTGQLHKGDAGNGLFVQFISEAPHDLAIPDRAGSPESSINFGVLKRAQALGDRQALLDAGRRVISFDLDSDVIGVLRRLMTG